MILPQLVLRMCDEIPTLRTDSDLILMHTVLYEEIAAGDDEIPRRYIRTCQDRYAQVCRNCVVTRPRTGEAARFFFSFSATLRKNRRGRRLFGSETGANALQTGANAPAVTVYAANSELEKAIERQHEVNCLIAVKNQKLVALKSECNDKVDDGQTPRTNPR